MEHEVWNEIWRTEQKKKKKTETIGVEVNKEGDGRFFYLIREDLEDGDFRMGEGILIEVERSSLIILAQNILTSLNAKK